MPTEKLARFLREKSAVGLSSRTTEWYQMCVGNYLAFADGQALGYAEPDTLTAFLAHMRAHGYANATVSGYFTALSAWFNWLVHRGDLAESPMRRIQRPRKARKRKNYVTQAEFNNVYAAIPAETWCDLRDRGMLLLLFYSGLRLGEVRHLAVEDIDASGQFVHVISGKGDKDRVAPCHPKFGPTIHDYLQLRPAYDGPAVFVANDGHGRVRGPLSEYGVRSILARRFQAAGLRYRNPHAFRHGFAMLFLNNGMELSAVSSAMGHSSSKVTEDEYAYWLTAGMCREYTDALRRAGGSD